MSVYPGDLDEFPIRVAHVDTYDAQDVNDVQAAIAAVEAELGTDPAGSAADLKTRLAVRIANDGKIKQPQQLVTLGKTNADYATIEDAHDEITDAAADKIYTILAFPGEYDEPVALKNYVNIVALDPKSTTILQQVTDTNVECHCYLNIGIRSSNNAGIRTEHADSVVHIAGDVSSLDSYAAWIINGTVVIRGDVYSSSHYAAFNDGGGTLTIYGDVTSGASNGAQDNGGLQTIYGNVLGDVVGAMCGSLGTQIISGNITSTGSYAVHANGALSDIRNGLVTCNYDNANGHGFLIETGGLVVQNVRIVCTHADAKSIYAAAARDARCMAVWANRDDHANVTQLITGGFTFDADVQ